MKIAVCVKQVPNTSNIKWTANDTIQREGLESIINPYDIYAIDTAVKIKELLNNVKITALSMGPNQAEDVLRYAISVGVDEAILLTDRNFSGADTIATAKTLAGGIKKIGEVDLILCGQFAIDGDTGQTALMLAHHLKFAQATFVKEVLEVQSDYVIVKRQVEDGFETVKVKLPAVVCMLKGDYEPKTPFSNGFKKTQEAEVLHLTMEDLHLNTEDVGLKGSPTYVSKTFRLEIKREGKLIESSSVNESVDLIFEALNNGK